MFLSRFKELVFIEYTFDYFKIKSFLFAVFDIYFAFKQDICSTECKKYNINNNNNNNNNNNDNNNKSNNKNII